MSLSNPPKDSSQDPDARQWHLDKNGEVEFYDMKQPYSSTDTPPENNQKEIKV